MTIAATAITVGIITNTVVTGSTGISTTIITTMGRRRATATTLPRSMRLNPTMLTVRAILIRGTTA